MLTCSDCRHFDRRADREEGRCRRVAPRGRGPAVWPEVSSEDWCGDFAAGDQTLIATDEGVFSLPELSEEDREGLLAFLTAPAVKKEVK